MKTLLPCLKTKLFLLGFIFTSTLIIATTVTPEISNNKEAIIAKPENTVVQKKKTTQKKISLKQHYNGKTEKNPNSVDRVRIKIAKTSPMNSSLTSSSQKDELIIQSATLDVKIFSNPGQNHFSLYLEGATNERVHITVYDALGRQVKIFEKENANIPVIFGSDLKVGVYVVEVRQGTNRKTVKLIKQ